MKDLSKYTREEVIAYCTQLEAKLAVLKISKAITDDDMYKLDHILQLNQSITMDRSLSEAKEERTIYYHGYADGIKSSREEIDRWWRKI